MFSANGWTLYELPSFKTQKAKLDAEVAKQKAKDPDRWESAASAKLSQALENLTLRVIPSDPGAKQFRLGNTLGKGRKHWFRAKFGNGRYRLFYQYNLAAKVIIYAWVNDANTLRTYESKADAYAVFKTMLDKGNPPASWEGLAQAVKAAEEPVKDVIGKKARERKC